MPAGWICHVSECDSLHTLVIVSTSVESDDVNKLSDLTIAHLGICDVALTDVIRNQVISEIGEMPNLCWLNLENCGFTDSQVKEIKLICIARGIEFASSTARQKQTEGKGS